MTALDSFNPITLFLYIGSISLIPMFCFDPVLSAIALAAGSCLCFTLKGQADIKNQLSLMWIFVGVSLFNPLFSHKGETVLFYLNRNPITLEAVLYGMSAALSVIAVLLLFRAFSHLISSDKLIYIFGRISPRLALLISMSLRFIPMLISQGKKIHSARRTMGLCQQDNIIAAIKNRVEEFSCLTTWGLENSIITADSMQARGAGSRLRRTHFAIYRFRIIDFVMLVISIGACFLMAYANYIGCIGYEFYPCITGPDNAVIFYLIYFAAAFLPTAIQIGGALRWRYYESRI